MPSSPGVGRGSPDLDRGPGPRRAFVVRVRVIIDDGSGNVAGPLRGSVELVDGDVLRYFTSIEGMAAIIRDALFPPARPPTG